MTGKGVGDIDLMLYRDGELDETASAEVVAALAVDDDARRRLRALDQISETVRTSSEYSEEAADAAFAGLWERVERGISANGQSAPAKAAPARPGLGERLSEWFSAYRFHFVTGAVCASAAAVLVLALSPEPQVITVKGPAANPPTAIPVLQPSDPVVESLEVSGGSGTIMTLPGEGGESPTTVIWIAIEDSEEAEGPL